MKTEQKNPFPLLQLLIETMEEVVNHKLPFDIQDYFTDEARADLAKDIHTCGTAACIAGYGGVSPAVQKFLDIDTEDQNSNYWGEQVVHSLEGELGLVAYAIVSGCHLERRGQTYDYLPDLALGFSHVNKQEPTAEEALAFMKYVLECCLDGRAQGVPNHQPREVATDD